MPRRAAKKKQRDLHDRPAANTTLGEPRIKEVRVRGGSKKVRALQLRQGNFCLASQNVAAKCEIVEILYNPSDSELVRRGVITKGTIVKINPFPLLMHAQFDPSHHQLLQDGLACITTRPGQCGRADGYILEGEEKEFYLKKMRG